jgi:hypothetical protein
VVESILKTLDEVIHELVTTAACPAYSFEGLVRLFREKMKNSRKETKDFLEAIVSSAWELLSQRKDKNRYWVAKTTSVEIYANTLFEWYPKAKFLHLLRDPRDNYGAIKAGWDKRYQYQFDGQERLLQSVIDRARLGMEMAEINQERFGKEQYLILKYEDLVSNPEKVLERVCDFLGIRFQASLLTPTLCGVLWKGNNFEANKFNSISNKNLNRWKERISPHEAKVLEFYFKDLMPKYGYPLAYDLQESADAAREHYKWFNYAQPYSLKIDKTYSIKNGLIR